MTVLVIVWPAAATVLLARGLDQVDTTGLAVLPLDPPLTAPVLLIPRPRLAPEAFEDLADHLREADADCPLSLAGG